jgi:hypothetical protein
MVPSFFVDRRGGVNPLPEIVSVEASRTPCEMVSGRSGELGTEKGIALRRVADLKRQSDLPALHEEEHPGVILIDTQPILCHILS